MERQESLAKWVMELVDLDPKELDVAAFQPRSTLDEAALEQLMISMRETGGNLEPVLVRRNGEKLEVVAGHHRVEAAKRLGIPVLASVQELDEKEAWQIALIANLVMKDMDPLDEARALQRLSEQLGLSHEEIAKRLGRDRSYVSRRIKLLSLPSEVLNLLREPHEEYGTCLTVAHLVELLNDELTVGGKKSLAKKASAQHWTSKTLRSAVQESIRKRRIKQAEAEAFLKVKETVENTKESGTEPIDTEAVMKMIDEELRETLKNEEVDEYDLRWSKQRVAEKLAKRGHVGSKKETAKTKKKDVTKIPDKLTWKIDKIEFYPKPKPHIYVKYCTIEGYNNHNVNNEVWVSLNGIESLTFESFMKHLYREIRGLFTEKVVLYGDSFSSWKHVEMEFPSEEDSKLRDFLQGIEDRIRKYGKILTPPGGLNRFGYWVVVRDDHVYVYCHDSGLGPEPFVRAKFKIVLEESEINDVPSDLELKGFKIHGVSFVPGSEEPPVQLDITFPEGNRELMFFENVEELVSWLKHEHNVSTVPDEVSKMLESVLSEEKAFAEQSLSATEGEKA